MGWEIGLLLIGIMGTAWFAWYLYQRSKNETAEDTDQATDAEADDDGFEDLLLTGVMLNEMSDDDEDSDSSDDMDAEDHNLMSDGGFDDSGGLE